MLLGTTDSQEGIVLTQNARILFDSANVIRIRTGIWNFEEAVIDFLAEPEAVGDAVHEAFRSLANGEALNLETIGLDMEPLEKAKVVQLFSDLVQSGLLVDTASKTYEMMTMRALMGMVRDYEADGHSITSDRKESSSIPAVIVSDNRQAQEEALRLAEQLGLPARLVGESTLSALQTSDLTTLTDTYLTDNLLKEISTEFADTGSILALFQRPSLVTLRNLNRAVERFEKSLIVGLIDGPFLSIIGTQPPYTGCFECFELRSLARLEDHVIYHKFASTLAAGNALDGISPLMGLLTNLVLTEGFLEVHLGVSRFAGRVLNIYLPTLEIQAQDLLRMPGCPACGYVTKQRPAQINYNARVVVDRITAMALG